MPTGIYSKTKEHRQKISEKMIGNNHACYLCEKFIQFGQDSLEHKTPLSRGGTNEYSNLAIAHKSCNSKKQNKTETEYRKGLVKL